MKRENWIWMPHPAHFICSYKCHFFLATYVGKYIVSTVGEMADTNEHHERCQKGTWEEIGCGRKYETMVFKAVKDKENKCCPWSVNVETELDVKAYNTAEEATEGHYKLCNKWSKETSQNRQ